MQGSLVAWLTLGSGLIVLVALLYELARPTEEAHVRPLMLAIATLGMGGIIGSLPKLFEIHNAAVDVTVSAIQIGCTAYAIRQMFRFHAEKGDREPTP